MNELLKQVSAGKRISIGMVHTLPTPGTLLGGAPVEEIIARAVADAKALETAGFDAVIVENVNDAPFDTPITRTQVAALAVVCHRVREAVGVPVGVDSCNDALAGFEIGGLTGISFIRVPYFVDTRIGQYGVVNPNGAAAVMLRHRLGLDQIKIFADVQVKHTFGLNDGIPLEQSAKWATDMGADALIVTGSTTGVEAPLEALRRVKGATKLPVVAGSGVTAQNLPEQYAVCDGAIIGTALKEGGSLLSPINSALSAAFMAAAKAFRDGGGKG